MKQRKVVKGERNGKEKKKIGTKRRKNYNGFKIEVKKRNG